MKLHEIIDIKHMLNEGFDLEVLKYLLSWAITLTPYGEAPLPVVEEKPHSFFVEEVCNGVECNVLAWYNDKGIVYVDNNITDDELRDEMVFHEFVHYLQDKHGNFDTYSCEDSIAREKEAYKAQSRFAVEARGRLPRPVNHRVRCKK